MPGESSSRATTSPPMASISIVFGAVLVLWIVYELFVLPETLILQPILIGVGLAIAGIPLLPSMRHWFAITGDERAR